MKTTRQNNPVALAFLITLLGFLVWRLVGQVRAIQTSTVRPSAAAPANLAATPMAPHGEVAVAHLTGLYSDRDPFAHSGGLHLADTEVAGNVSPGKPSQDGGASEPPKIGPFAVLPTFGAAPHNPTNIRGEQAGATEGNPSPSRSDTLLPEGVTMAPPDAWKVTAIIGGARPSAILEGAGIRPVTLIQNDVIEGYRVATVRPNEVVLEGRGGIWTLPLDAPNSAPQGDNRPGATQEMRDARK